MVTARFRLAAKSESTPSNITVACHRLGRHRTPKGQTVGSELTFAIFGLSGVAAGFFAGLFGIGGGLIMVPVLVYAFTTAGIATQHVVTMALGTSMAAIVFSAAQSAYGHYRRGST